MNIIGINVSHNASASLMIDGKVILSVQEERFTRVKNFNGYPKQSIDYCLEYLRSRDLEVDKVAFSTVNLVGFWFAYPYPHFYNIEDHHGHYAEKYYGPRLAGKDVTAYYQELMERSKKENTCPSYLPFDELGDLDTLTNDADAFRELKRKFAAEQCGVDIDKVEFIDHHTCHAHYGYYASKVKSNNVAAITLDSDGDGMNQTLWQFKDGEAEKLRWSNKSDIARIYKMTTLLLGMKPDEHEFKVMGLAPYAKSSYVDICYKDVFEPLLKVEDGRIVHANRPPDMYEYLKAKTRPYRFDNIAGAVQKMTEVLAVELFRQAHEITGSRHFCVSGGVAMNIKMNMVLAQLDFVDQLYVPASGADESLCIGACYYLEKQNSNPLVNTYLGYNLEDDLSDEAIHARFGEGFRVTRHDSHEKVAGLLAEGKVVAVARGREEFGARALGNRSILANPKDPEVVKVINEAVKNRDFWMPFALSILNEDAADYLVNPKGMETPFMTIGFDTKPENYHKIKAGTHPYDRTCRPQMVTKEANAQYHGLISTFKNITGIPALLNTSLNLHGSPICSTLEDVAYTFKNSGLDCLYINDDYLIEKL